MSNWAPAGPERFRLFDTAPLPVATDTGLSTLATPSAGAAQEASMWHPANPLFAFGLLGALTFGLMAFSTSGAVRVGKTTVKTGLSVGAT